VGRDPTPPPRRFLIGRDNVAAGNAMQWHVRRRRSGEDACSAPGMELSVSARFASLRYVVTPAARWTQHAALHVNWRGRKKEDRQTIR